MVASRGLAAGGPVSGLACLVLLQAQWAARTDAREVSFDWRGAGPGGSARAHTGRGKDTATVVQVTPVDSLLFRWEAGNTVHAVRRVAYDEYAGACPGAKAHQQQIMHPAAGPDDDEDEVRRLIAAEGVANGWLQVDLEDDPPGSIAYFMSGGDSCRRAKVRIEQYVPVPCVSTSAGEGAGGAHVQDLGADAQAAAFTDAVFGGGGWPGKLVVETVAGSTPPHPDESEEDCEHEDKGYGNGTGTGTTEVKGDQARFSYPWGCAFSHKHQWLLVADNGCAVSIYPNDRLKRVSVDGTTAVLAGGYQGYRDGQGAEARFRHIAGVVVDDARDIAYVADSGNHCVRKVDLLTGQVTTVVGHGTDTSYETVGGFKDGTLVSAHTPPLTPRHACLLPPPPPPPLPPPSCSLT